jgi:glycosyltransferase involved in cell wall biosynthesis
MYLARELAKCGPDVRVYTLTRGEFYERHLTEANLTPVWFGRSSFPPVRQAALIGNLRRFRPHLVQSFHAFTNPYGAVGARFVGAISLGGVRSDLSGCRGAYGRLTPQLIRMPHAIAFNSQCALREFTEAGLIAPERGYVLANAIDLSDYHRPIAYDDAGTTAIFIGRLIQTKRLDIYLRALAQARRIEPRLRGVVVGEGPELAPMRAAAASLGLLPNHVEFVGRDDDIPGRLKRAGILVLTSSSEGCPNVLLEAMAAYLPVITTAIGDVPRIVEDGHSGFLVPPSDPCEAVCNAMIRLAQSSDLRLQMGEAGRKTVEANYSLHKLGERALRIYEDLFAKHPSTFRQKPRLVHSEIECEALRNQLQETRLSS